MKKLIAFLILLLSLIAASAPRAQAGQFLVEALPKRSQQLVLGADGVLRSASGGAIEVNLTFLGDLAARPEEVGFLDLYAGPAFDSAEYPFDGSTISQAYLADMRWSIRDAAGGVRLGNQDFEEGFIGVANISGFGDVIASGRLPAVGTLGSVDEWFAHLSFRADRHVNAENGTLTEFRASFDSFYIQGNFIPTAVPEPASIVMMGLGFAALGLREVRRRRGLYRKSLWTSV